MKTRTSVILFGIFLILLLMPKPAHVQQPKILKVGCTEPLNNPLGIEAKKCLEILVEELNKAGGVKIKGETYHIELIVYDDKYRADVARAAVERLVYQDKVKFIVGQLGSAPVVGELPVTEANKILVFAGAVTEKYIEPANRYTLRFTGHSGLNWVYLSKHYPNVRSMASYTIDDETGHYTQETQTKCAKAFGLKIMDPVFFPRPTVDFAPFATKIKSMNPDLVSTWGSSAGTQLGLQYKALYEAGWRGVKSSSVYKEDEVSAVCPNEAVEGLMILYQDPSKLPRPPAPAIALREAYLKKYGKWDPTGVSWCTPWNAFIAALKKADSVDPEEIKAAMAGLEFVGMDGNMKMIRRPDQGTDRYCDVMKEQHVGIIKGGKIAYGDTVSIEEAKKFIEKVYGFAGKWG